MPRATAGLRWAIAVASTAAAVGLTLALRPVLYPIVTPLLLLAVAAAALAGGLGPGLLAALLSGLAAHLWLTPPPGSVGFADAAELAREAVFWVAALLLAVLCAGARVAQLGAAAREGERDSPERGIAAAASPGRAEPAPGPLGPAPTAELPEPRQLAGPGELADAPETVSVPSAVGLEADGAERITAPERGPEREPEAELAEAELAEAEATWEPAEWGVVAAEPPGPGVALVVESDGAIRRLACQVLDQEGYAWLSASDATEALELLDRYGLALELLLVDATLPETSGARLAEWVRDLQPGVPALFIVDAPAAGADGPCPGGAEPCIPKPFTAADLAARLRQLTGRGPAAASGPPA